MSGGCLSQHHPHHVRQRRVQQYDDGRDAGANALAPGDSSEAVGGRSFHPHPHLLFPIGFIPTPTPSSTLHTAPGADRTPPGGCPSEATHSTGGRRATPPSYCCTTSPCANPRFQTCSPACRAREPCGPGASNARPFAVVATYIGNRQCGGTECCCLDNGQASTSLWVSHPNPVAAHIP